MSIPLGLCQCGCGGETKPAPRIDTRRGHVKGVPVRYLKGHGPRRNAVPYLVDEATGCWNWNRRLKRTGYPGEVGTGKARRLAHRAYYEDRYGAVPAGLELDHLCRNRRCVNPDHLQPVTGAENVRRSAAAKLTIDDAREIRRLYRKVPTRSLATRFGVSASCIQLVGAGKAWREEVA